MAMTPEAQKKAQAQIDTVVGRHRVPTIEDRPLLPYIDAIFRETLRYHPVVPLGKCCAHALALSALYLSISGPTRCRC